VRAIPVDDIRPVLATDPRWTGEGVELELERSLVRIDDDTGRLRPVLDACDGRTSVLELTTEFGPDARGLIDELLGAGALVDVEQGWRRFHRLSGNPSPVGRGISDEEASELMSEAFAPTEPVGDPVALEPAKSEVGRAARRRSSARAGPEPRPLRWEQLGSLLSIAYGPARSGWFTVPSGGALYPLVVHVLVRKAVGPLQPGVWWYDHRRGELRQQRPGRPDIESLLVSHPVTDPLAARDEPILAVSADLARPCRKYGGRGYRFALMETGAVMQSAYLVGAELDVPVRACAGYHDGGVNALLGHRDSVVCTLLLFVGA